MASFVSFNPNTTLGAYQIGVLVSYMLFRVTTAQTYIYYGRFPDDSPKFKALVLSDYVHPEHLDLALPKSFPAAILFSGIIAGSVQGFFSFRIYAFSKKLCIPLLIWAMAFLRVLACTAQWEWLFMMAKWTVSSVNDLMIMVTMTFLLNNERINPHHWSLRTAALMDKLIAWTISFATGIVMLACVCCYVFMINLAN
ncbi:hypothetical protein B0H13DRAFT_2081077 [Mycena leptocephala]|nr:hypothetical protein B0H13DRAFT_2081077 [Mycena leptocephala]